MISCTTDEEDSARVAFVCEHKMEPSGTVHEDVHSPPSVPSVVVAHLPNDTYNQVELLRSSAVVCPRSHWTHSFLACDIMSACWARRDVIKYSQERMTWGIPASSTCPPPLTSLPPYFRCLNDVDHVPYTMVCDYRQDCSDNSDEDFCLFPPCEGSFHFQCHNKQVHPCLLYTSPSPRDISGSRMPSSA